MAEAEAIPEPSKTYSLQLALFLPSVNRHSQPIDQDGWLAATLELLGRLFGGATAFPRGRGVWRDDLQGGLLIYDDPIVVHCYTSPELLEKHLSEVVSHLVRWGHETKQGAVAYAIAGTYLEISMGAP